MTAGTLPLANPIPGRRPSRAFEWFLCLLFAAITVPYTTNFLAWSYGVGIFPVRPVLYLLAVPPVGILVGILMKPDLNRTVMLIPLLLSWMIFDAVVLRRYVSPEGNGLLIKGYASSVIVVLASICLIGSFMRWTTLPVLFSTFLTITICGTANLAEWFGIFAASNVEGRAAGFSGDPNNACIAICTALAVFLTLNKKLWLSFVLLGFSVVGVTITLSRSGMLAMVFITLMFVAHTFTRRPALVLKMVAVVAPLAVIGAMVLFQNQDSSLAKDDDIQNRMGALFGGNVEKLESSERMKDLMDGVEAFVDKPVIGHGAGAGTIKWHPHNQLVSAFVDGGVLNAGLYLLLLTSLSLKVISNRGKGTLCLFVVLVFIPFSQLLLHEVGHWLAVIVLAHMNSGRVFQLRLNSDRYNQKEWQHA